MSILDLSRPSRRHWLGYLLLVPAVALICLLIVYPLIVSVDLSFQNIGIARLGQNRQPFTTVNYQQLISSSEFWQSAWFTIELITVVTFFCFVFGLATALLVNNRFRGRTLARLIVSLPWAVPEVIAVVIFSWIFDSSFGVVNWVLIRLGLIDTMINWLSSPSAAFAVVAVTMVWKGYPFVSIMTLAGMQSIPEDLYNAAKVDGAGPWQRLINITLPGLMPIAGVTMVLVMLWVFRDFSIIYVLTGGGPFKSTQSLAILTYLQAFSFFHMGYAAAVGTVTMVICVIASRLLITRAPTNF